MQENLIPILTFKDKISHQFRDIASLPLKMGGINIKLPSDYEKILKWSIKTSSFLDRYDSLTAISEKKKSIRKLKHLKLKEQTKRELTF